MKVVIDISKLPCKNGKSCTDCYFYTGDLCGVPAQLENFPKLEERPHGEWIEVPKYKGFYVCSKCLERMEGNFWRFDHWEMKKENFCSVCGSDNRKRGEEK